MKFRNCLLRGCQQKIRARFDAQVIELLEDAAVGGPFHGLSDG